MIRVDCKQGTPQWRKARLGVVTASGFDHIITPATHKAAASGTKYLNNLIAEWALGRPLEEDKTSPWMDRGTGLEPEARAFYAIEKGVEVEEVGFLLRDDRKVGCSPDGLVEKDGGLEIKCPAAHTHIGYLLDPWSLVAAYRGQIQGGLLITGRAWWDILSYNPELPPVIQRVQRDPVYVEALEPLLEGFLNRLDRSKAKVRAAADAAPAFAPVPEDERRRRRAMDDPFALPSEWAA